jgi:hypothetical protein
MNSKTTSLVFLLHAVLGAHAYDCFGTGNELRAAVQQWFSETGNSKVLEKYGYMKDWCVSSVEDFSGVFIKLRIGE